MTSTRPRQVLPKQFPADVTSSMPEQVRESDDFQSAASVPETPATSPELPKNVTDEQN